MRSKILPRLYSFLYMVPKKKRTNRKLQTKQLSTCKTKVTSFFSPPVDTYTHMPKTCIRSQMYKTSIHTNITKLNLNSRVIKIFLNIFPVFFTQSNSQKPQLKKEKHLQIFFDSKLRLFRFAH